MATKPKSDQKLAEKPKTGRPSSYRPEYCQKLIEHMSKGYSFDSFAAIADVNPDTLYEWAKVHPEFSETKKKAFARSLLFWEQQGISGLWTSKEESFNTALWIFNMKNRHKWTDRVDVTEHSQPTGLEKTSDDELDKL